MNYKEKMREILVALGNGDDRPLIAVMAEEMRWNWMGSGQYQKSFNGKMAVVNQLLAAAKATIKQPAKATINNLFGDGNYVIAEMTGDNTTTKGKPYHNRYCWICRFENDQLYEINEYMDTLLVSETFV